MRKSEIMHPCLMNYERQSDISCPRKRIIHYSFKT